MPNMCVFNSAGGRACVCVDFANRKRVYRHGAVDLRAARSVHVLESLWRRAAMVPAKDYGKQAQLPSNTCSLGGAPTKHFVSNL